MLQGSLAWPLVTYAIPIMLTSVLQLLFNAADLVVVGRYCGSVSVAAVGSTGAITNLIINLFIGMSVGAGVAVAHGIGSREQETVFRTVHTAVPLAAISGIFLTVVGFPCPERFSGPCPPRRTCCPCPKCIWKSISWALPLICSTISAPL